MKFLDPSAPCFHLRRPLAPIGTAIILAQLQIQKYSIRHVE